MNQERLIMAIGRLERALSRAETNGDRLMKQKNDNSSGDNQNYQILEKKYSALKQQANQSLKAIETLLANQVDS